MIIAKTPHASTPRWLQAALVLFTSAVLPLGVAYAQDPDVDAVTHRLRAAVQSGEINKQQARAMLEALRRNTQRGQPATHARQRADDASQRELKELSERLAALEQRLAKMAQMRTEVSKERTLRAVDGPGQVDADGRAARKRRNFKSAMAMAPEAERRKGGVGGMLMTGSMTEEQRRRVEEMLPGAVRNVEQASKAQKEAERMTEFVERLSEEMREAIEQRKRAHRAERKAAAELEAARRAGEQAAAKIKAEAKKRRASVRR